MSAASIDETVAGWVNAIKDPLEGGEQKVSLVVDGTARFSCGPFAIQSIVRDTATATLAWSSVPGCTYRIETSPDLVTWTAELGDFRAIASLTTGNVDSTTFGENHFFRVKSVQ